jgi:hypothetical protein
MKIDSKQVLKVVRRLDTNSRLTHQNKFEIMRQVVQHCAETKEKYSDSHWSLDCKDIIEKIRRIRSQPSVPATTPVDREDLAQFRGTWNLMINYLEDVKNWDRPCHFLICRVMNEYIAENFIDLRHELGFVSGVGAHRWSIFVTSVNWDLSMEESKITRSFGFDLLYAFSTAFWSTVYTPKGLINVCTRKPLDIKEQKQFFDKLIAVDRAFSEDEKLRVELRVSIIKKIVDSYQLCSKLSPSNSSLELENILRKKAPEQAWPALYKFVLQKEDNCLLNNGKALFLCIYDVMMKHELTATPTPAPALSFR